MICTLAYERVLFDSSAIITFVQAGEIYRLSTYIGAKGAVTIDVEKELLRKSQGDMPDLIALSRLGWPPGESLSLPPRLAQEAADIRKVEMKPGEHPNAHLGEVSTALMTQHLESAVAVMEDEFGKKICRRRNVPRISTALLAAEMVAASELDEESGYKVYELATPSRVGHPEFVEAVEKARLAVGSTRR